MKNDVWDVVPRLERKFVVTSKWIYKIKHAKDVSIRKYKARIMAHGFKLIMRRLWLLWEDTLRS